MKRQVFPPGAAGDQNQNQNQLKQREDWTHPHTSRSVLSLSPDFHTSGQKYQQLQVQVCIRKWKLVSVSSNSHRSCDIIT